MALLTATAVIVASCLWYAVKYRLCFSETLTLKDWPLCVSFVLATYTTVYCLVHEIGALFIWANTLLFLLGASKIVSGRHKVFSAVCTLNIFFYSGELQDPNATTRRVMASVGLALSITFALVYIYDNFITKRST